LISKNKYLVYNKKQSFTLFTLFSPKMSFPSIIPTIYNDAEDEDPDYNNHMHELFNDRHEWGNYEMGLIQNELAQLQDDVDLCPNFKSLNYFKNMVDTYWVVTYYTENIIDPVTKYYSIEEYSLSRLKAIWDTKAKQMKIDKRLKLRSRSRY
jgi:hypothetical protein